MIFTWSDIWPHLLLIPLYQILGTIRHELMHALFGKWNGLRITKIHVWPGLLDGRWMWGYVQWEGQPKSLPWMRHVYLAPYYINFVCLVSGVLILNLVEWENFHWLAVTAIVLVISPVIDTLYNILKYVVRRTGDWALAFPDGGR